MGYIESSLPFLCMIASRCFINGYIYVQAPAETRSLTQLQERIENRLNAGRTVPEHWIAIVAAYFPLSELASANVIANARWQDELQAVVGQQIVDVFEEHKAAQNIARPTPIREDVSRSTRAEYERHPFPRWASLPLIAPELSLSAFLQSHLPALGSYRFECREEPSILVAGCGAGLDACMLAARIPQATVSGVDLSRASLGFASHKVQALGLPNI